EDIPADRVRKLRDGQAAPEGFWFPARGIGQLMDAMADAATAAGAEILTGTAVSALDTAGGRVRGVRADGPGGALELRAPAAVVAMPAGLAARLLAPAPPPGALPAVRMRAVAIAYLEVVPAQPLPHAWIQVDDPSVPFARCALPGNWSAALVPGDRTVFGCECYCAADPGDPVWGLDDDALAASCHDALLRLGWAEPGAAWRPVEVLRLPRAYPLPHRDQMAAVSAPAQVLADIAGLHQAPGAAVIEAIEGGERAALAALAGAPAGTAVAG
ncbi:MAG: FAD-dependent oxidoreductase, partial [Miltoncostaeaceae bacterium]